MRTRSGPLKEVCFGTGSTVTGIAKLLHIGFERFWLDVTALFVCNDNPSFAELRDQPCHDALGGFGIPTRLHENSKRIDLGIDRPPGPVLHPVDQDHNLVQMPSDIWAGTVPTDAG